VFGALAHAVPHLVPACGSNLPEVGVSFGGVDEEGKSFVYLEFLLASWGGGPDHDGMDACTGTLVNYSNTPAEMIEADTPIAIERYGFVPDTGGAGRWRGGLAIERHLRFKSKRATLQIRSDRREHLAYGLDGGGPGAAADVTIRRVDGGEEHHPPKFLTTVHCGDLLKLRLSGAGGHGNPLERDPAAVLDDLLEQKITAAHAREVYGVVIAGEPPQVDQAATAALRAKRRNERSQG
jgi:N-methylhydantoinase B